MPSGLRMSADWITASPSIDSAGPGGAVVSLRWLRKTASPSAGFAVPSAATFLAFMVLNRNPAAAHLAKNLGGVIFAVAIMLDCLTMRIIAAVRLSRLVDQTTSVESQTESMREYAARLGHVIV